MTEVHRSHFAQLVAINAIWGFNIVAVKLSADRFPPVFLTFLRFLIVALAVWPWLRIRRGEMRWLLIAAICSGGLQFALMYSGVALSESMSSIAIGSQLGVPFATLLSVLLLGERIHWRRWVGIGMAFAGVVIVGYSPGVLGSWSGFLLIVIAAFVGAVGLVAIKRVRELEALELQAWLAWGSLPLLLPLSLLLEDGQAREPSVRRRDGLERARVLGRARQPRRAHSLLRPHPPVSRLERRPGHRADAPVQRAVLRAVSR